MNTTPQYLSGWGDPHRAQERRVVPSGPPGLRLRFYPGVPAEVCAELKAFARWARRHLAFRHPVRVTVVPHATVMGHDGAAGWAVFLIPGEDYVAGDVVRIFVGGGSARVLRRAFGFTSGEATAKVVHDLAHELVHYEQWRDGRRVDERNVNRRAAHLVRRYRGSRPDRAGRRPPYARAA